MDLELVHTYEQQSFGTSEHTAGVDEIRQRYTGFMTGVTVTYPSSPLVAQRENNVARNIHLGMRLPSFQVVNQASARPQHLAERLVNNWILASACIPGRCPSQPESSRRICRTLRCSSPGHDHTHRGAFDPFQPTNLRLAPRPPRDLSPV